MRRRQTWLHRHRRIVSVVLALLWVTAFVLTHIPAKGLHAPRVSDKFLHVVGYAGLAFVLGLTLQAYRVGAGKAAVTATLLLATYGIFDEYTQPMFRRTASLHDWFADIAGTLLGLLGAQLLVWLLSPRRAPSRPAA